MPKRTLYRSSLDNSTSSSSSEKELGEAFDDENEMPRAKKEKMIYDKNTSRQRHICVRGSKPTDRLSTNRDWLWRYGALIERFGTKWWCCRPCYSRIEAGRVGKEHILPDTELGRRRATEHLRIAHNQKPELDVYITSFGASHGIYNGWAWVRPKNSNTTITNFFGLDGKPQKLE